MVAMTISCMASRCGPNLSVIPAVRDQTHHRASSNTSVWKPPLQPRRSISSCERVASAKTNTRSKNSSRNAARWGSPGLRSSSAAPLVVIARPFYRLCGVLKHSYHSAMQGEDRLFASRDERILFWEALTVEADAAIHHHAWIPPREPSDLTPRSTACSSVCGTYRHEGTSTSWSRR